MIRDIKTNHKTRLKVLFVSSEFAGIAQTGGLGEVSYSLPRALKKLGVDVRVVLPFYSALFKGKTKKIIDSLIVRPGDIQLGCAVHKTQIENVPIYLIEHHSYFNRPRLYDDGSHEYNDNPERFCLLSAAALALAEKIDFIPHCVHCNDWQTALVPLYVSRLRETNLKFKDTKSLLTIHNGFFQGKYSAFFQGFLGLQEAFHMYAYEEFGYINILKGGIFYADYTNSVSRGYADELLSTDGSHGLYMTYRQKRERFFGILNGCEYDEWNPETDDMIAKNYSVYNIAGKKKCRVDLLKNFGLDHTKDWPVIGMISRLTAQKGFYYAIPAFYELLKKKIFLVVVGDGASGLVNSFHHLKYLFGDKLGWHHGYSKELAHKIEAGSDMFLMPSLFEPCGLNQMYSQRYGTLPIVRAVGGLKDTVTNYDEKKLNASSGFVFQLPMMDAVYNTVSWAVDIYSNKPDNFSQVVKAAMLKRYDWETVAKEYIAAYSGRR